MNPATFSAAELAAATGGRWDGVPAPGRIGVFTDTRQSGVGLLFIALAGERFDAHAFLDRAVESGAAALCIRESFSGPTPIGIPVLRVRDTLAAYQAVAGWHRRRFSQLGIAAVTGSVGKTSVKEMLAAIGRTAAGSAGAVVSTVGNTNNQVGVPQNLLRLTAATRYAVIEMGTNHPGEILPLSRITMPEVAVVNSIAPCHLEFLGDLDGVAREKATIFAGLRPEGTAVIPADLPQEPILRRAAGEHRILTFGASKAADCRVEYLGGALAGSRFRLIFITGEDFTVDWRLTGAHQAINAAAAAAVAQVLGIAPALIAAGLPETVLPGMRMKTAVIAGVTYINDAYNANPASMQAALTQLLELHPSGRLILVLGGMCELGEVSLAEHHSLLEFVHREFPEALTITVGAEFDGLDSPRHFAAAADVAPVLSALVRSGDVVFAKGSRGVGVENALPPAAR